MHAKEDVDRLAMEFEQCRKILVALGDENRQHMIFMSVMRQRSLRNSPIQSCRTM